MPRGVGADRGKTARKALLVGRPRARYAPIDLAVFGPVFAVVPAGVYPPNVVADAVLGEAVLVSKLVALGRPRELVARAVVSTGGGQ